MPEKRFSAMVVREAGEKKYERKIEERSLADLPEGEVLIRVLYSSLNYKDALSAIGNKGVTRNYPHTPGIDGAGTVENSTNPDFKAGDRVLVTGYDLGMNTSGGFGQYIRVPAQWVIPIPEKLSIEKSMAFGTAGLTAALSVIHLEDRGIAPEGGPVLVTGASGGVGSLAVSFLAAAGYEVAAVTGKADARDFLTNIGAKTIVGREEVTDTSKRPLLKSQWTGVVDTVGGDILSTAIRSTKLHGSITCCGNAASGDLPLTVYPFILRGVNLLGVDSQNCTRNMRLRIWDRLASEWNLPHIDDMTKEVPLADLSSHIDEILNGQKMGRTVVNLE